MSVHSRPRAVIGALRAQSGPAQVMAEIQSAFEEFKAHHNGHLDNAQKAIDDINARMAAIGANGSGSGASASDGPPSDPAYTTVFSSWFRHGHADDQLRAANREGGRQQIHAAMSAGSASDGGYLAPIEWDRKVLKKLALVSPMRRISQVVLTTVRGYQTVWNGGSWGSGWVGETAGRPQTSSPTLSPLTFAAGEVYAMPAITAQLLDDADFDVDGWLAGELAGEFAKQEGVAFISGDGVNKPQGLLTYVTGAAAAAVHPGGAITIGVSGSAAALTPDGLIDLVFSLPAPYRQGAVWLMNSKTLSSIRKFKDAGNNYLFQPSLDLATPDRLCGYPIEIDENMPDIAAGNIPIVFGNFLLGYVINDRFGVRILRDPYTNKPYVNFYTTKRVGGGLRDPNAFRALKVAAS
ncbi:phage major capsid protein [Agrobacterium sp. Ap1]|uniref:phage major capsid protein n=1 Tax=Agrobacterium sp. Ap1 TaxID=2815337 RepID=UPI001A8F837F|nr:phage major capsid protein [Agrobacterium sp. Ap1]MBO0140216.1 phage major capsid protein [Agrobacterium sp. Ap1]